MITIRSWQRKRIALTAKEILVSNVLESSVADMIPFGHIMDVLQVDEESYLPLTIEGDEPINVLQITTAEDGYNCGRIYRLRPTSESFKDSLLHAIRQNSINEGKTRSMQTRVEIFQHKARALFNAKPTQYFLAIMIMSVR